MGAAHLAGVTAGLFTFEGLKLLDRGGTRFTPAFGAEERARRRREWLGAVARSRSALPPATLG
jgi:glycerol kinase